MKRIFMNEAQQKNNFQLMLVFTAFFKSLLRYEFWAVEKIFNEKKNFNEKKLTIFADVLRIPRL